MRDTTPEAARLMRELWLALPGEERILRTAGMFDAARAMVLASFPEGLTAEETRRRLWERLYGDFASALPSGKGERRRYQEESDNA